MRKKTLIFILSGMSFIILLTVSVLFVLNHYMDYQTLQDARAIARTYLEGVAEEEIYNYLSISDIRHTQIKFLEKKLSEDENSSSAQSTHAAILDAAGSQDIKVCALVDSDGEIETEFGSSLISVGNPASLIEKLKLGEDIVMTGKSEEDDLIVWACPGAYPMSNGKQSIGVLYCRDMDQFIEKLHLDTDKGLANFFIIRRDGSYVVRTGQTTEDNYFDRILAHGTPVGATSEEKVEELKKAIADNATWAIEVTYADERYGIDERRSVRADPLPGSNWYLVSILPYGALDSMIENMSRARYSGMLVALAVLISGIILVVILYIRLTRRQVSALEASQKKAEAAQKVAEKAKADLEYTARTDGMTKLWNRLEIQNRIEDAFQKYQNNGIGFSLIMADIDHFKNVNDTYGHQEGDTVIKSLAGILQEKEKYSPQRNSAGRWGGEEFMFLAIGLRKKNAAQMAENIRHTFEDQCFPISGRHTASLGVTEVHPDDTVDTLLARADEALYASKKNGRNQVTLL